ncbi:5-methylthioadenosine/S-adenosylhomocysteine deaminase, partial [Aureobasidium melanogenum]
MASNSSLYIHATIITVDKERRIILDGAMLIRRNEIVAIGKTANLLDDSLVSSDTEQIDCSGRIILPGLINTHAHLAQSLLRGLAEDLPLHSWLCDSIWPLEASFGPRDGYKGARLTIAEMLKSGTTCFLEAMLTHRSGFENVATAVDEMGIRACLGKLVKVEETNKATGMIDPRDRDISSMSIASALEAHNVHHGSCDGRLHVWMAAGTPRGSPAALHKAIGDACENYGLGLTMHCAEAPKDLDIFHDCYNSSPAEFCKVNNLIRNGGKTVLAHMVNLDLAKDVHLLSECGATVAHNPASNCKLASGIAPIPELMDGSVNVALGTDGAPCNNTYDMFQEMRLAGLIQKGVRRDAAVMSADTILEMATINGARALGLEDKIGSLEVGKLADFVVLRVGGLHCAPFDQEQLLHGSVDPVTTVVYSCTGSDIESVVVDGQVLVQGQRLLCADEDEILAQARQAVRSIRDSAGVVSRQAKNYV